MEQLNISSKTDVEILTAFPKAGVYCLGNLRMLFCLKHNFSNSSALNNVKEF